MDCMLIRLHHCQVTNIQQRLRYMSLKFREEILEFSFFKLDDTSRDQLQYVSSSPLLMSNPPDHPPQ
jgi:hypothetical protein